MSLTPEILKKYHDKKLSWLLKTLEKRVNKSVRIRDSEGEHFKCISCPKTLHISQMNAGHFFSVGDFSAVRFNLDNIHGQCIQCNLHKHGNGAKYSYNLKRKIGLKRFEDLEKAALIPFKWDRLVLISLIELFKEYK